MINKNYKTPAKLIKAVPYLTENGEWRMELVYVYDDKDGKHELTIPACEFNLTGDAVYIRQVGDWPCFEYQLAYSVFTNGSLKLFPVKNEEGREHVYVDRLVEPRVEEMTIAQIEKELGYKVKIINEEK